MIKDSSFMLVSAMVYLAIVYMLVRPGSNGPTIVNKIFSIFSDLVRGSIGYTYNSGNWNAP